MKPFHSFWKRFLVDHRHRAARRRFLANRERKSLLESLEDRRMMVATPAKFDFDTSTSPVASGYSSVIPNTNYNASWGYGWDSTPAGTATDMGSSYSDVQRDYISGTAARSFKVDLTNGTYIVALTSGAVRTGGITDTQVSINQTVQETFSVASGQFHTGVYTIAVSSGQLSLQLDDTGSTDDFWAINGLTITSAPSLGSISGSASYTEDGSPTVIASAATITDDNTSFSGGSLTATTTANSESTDVLSIQNQGTGSGQIGVSGANVSYSGTTIGTFTGGNGSTPLVITLNSSASKTATQALLRAITFSVTSDNPSTSSRTVSFQLNDGLNATSSAPTKTVSVARHNDASTISNVSGSLTYTEDTWLTSLPVTSAVVADPDTTDFYGGSVKVQITGNANSQDVLGIKWGNLVTTTTPDETNAGTVSYNGSPVGTFAGGLGANEFTISFDQNSNHPSLAVVQAIIRQLAFRSGNNPGDLPRTVTITLNDGTANSSSPIVTVNVTPLNDAPVLDNNLSPAFASIWEDATITTGNAVSSLLTGAIDDPDSGALQGIAVIGASTSGTWQFSLNGGSTWQALSSLSETTARLLRSSDLVRLLPGADFNGTATLTYRAWDRTEGTAGETLSTSGRTGGTGTFSSATETASLTVNPINDAPVLDNSPTPALTAIYEDTTNPAATTVSSLLGAAVTDVDAGAVQGIGVIGASNNGTWQYSLNGGSTWSSLGAVSASAARLLPATAQIRLIPNADFSGTATITYRAWDQTNGTAGSTLNTSGRIGGVETFSSDTETASLTVNPINDAPVLDNAPSPSLSAIAEDATNPSGTLVSSLLGGALSDVDASALAGIAVIGVSAVGTWQYSLNNGSTWLELSSVSETSARLLPSTTLVRLLPDPNYNGVASLTYRGWDQTEGSAGGTWSTSGKTGGTGTFSSALETAALTVTAVNDAPELDNSATPTFASIDEDATDPTGTAVSVLLGSSVTDVDAGSVQGIGVVGASNVGTWQYSLDGGANWTALGSVSESSARLLPSTAIVRLLPNANYNGTATLSYRAWDQTEGTAGSTLGTSGRTGGIQTFSTSTETASLTVNAVNDQPSVQDNVYSTNEDQTLTVLAAGVLENDGDVEGEAVSVSKVNGSAANVGVALNVAHGILTVNSDGSFTFVPVADYAGTQTFSYTARDINGADSAAATVTITMDAVNDAPVLDNSGAPSLPGIDEDVTSPAGSLVSSLVGNTITDVDSGALQGIGVIGFSEVGAWQYSLDGSNWVTINSASESTATLLPSTALLRLIPNTDYNGTATLSFRAWDRSEGTAGGTLATAGRTGGTGTFSAAIETASLVVAPLNDAPVLDNSPTPSIGTINEDAANPAGITVATLLGSAVTDVDAGAVQGIAVVAATAVGTWQYSLNGGTSWSALGDVSASAARLLPSTAKVRLLPDANYQGTAQLTYRAWDQSEGSAGATLTISGKTGGTGTFSEATESASIVINAVNDAPVLDTSGAPELPTIAEDVTNPTGTSISSLIGASISDIDDASLQGIAVVAVSDVGTWQYSVDNGTSWSALSSISEGTARLLPTSALVRLVPSTNYNGTAQFSYRAWDQSEGNAEETLSTTGRTGGIGTFSTAVETATLVVTAVNDAPVLDNSPTPAFPSIDEDAGSPEGATISSVIGATITDVDASALQGIAVVGASNAGAWEYSLNGGSSWSSIGSVSETSARLLPASALVRLVPNLDYTGTASLTYRAWDRTEGTAGGTLSTTGRMGGIETFSTALETASLIVLPINDAPAAVNDASYSTDEDVMLTVPTLGLLANDTDVDGDALTVSKVNGIASNVGEPIVLAHGTLTVNANGSFTFAPTANYSGQQTFTYAAKDTADAESISATVTINIQAVNDAPIASADSYGILENTTLTVNAAGVLANDSDIDSGSITATVVTNPTHGTLSLAADGSFVYTPDSNYNGLDSFTYQASDGDLDSNAVTVSLLVRDRLTLAEFGLDLTQSTVGGVPQTTSPVVYAVLAGDFTGTSARLEFKHSESGSVVGSLDFSSAGVELTYDPRVTDSQFPTTGSITLYHRLVQLDDAGQTIATGTWQSYSFAINSPQASTASVSNVVLVNNTGSTSDNKSTDPTLTGTVNGVTAGFELRYYVEMDSDNNLSTIEDRVPVVAVQETSGTSHHFTVTPEVAQLGAFSVQFRVREWSDADGAYRYGNWTSASTFVLEAPAAPAITDFKVVNGTLANGVWTTSDPLLSGKVATESTAPVAVHIDANNDGTYETVVYSDDSKEFSFRPTVAAGTQTINARTSYTDIGSGTQVFGAVVSLQLHYVPASLPNVSELHVVTVAGGGIITDPTVAGTLDGGATTDTVLVQIDENEDSVGDAWVTAAGGGQFTYRPYLIVPGTDVVVRARTARWDDTLEAYIYGSWVSVPFHYTAPTYTAGSVTAAMAQPLTGPYARTYDPAVTGSVSVVTAATSAYVTVEFDLDENLIPDASTTTDADGKYTFVPIGFGLGFHAVRVRTKEWNPVTRAVVYGGWSEPWGYTVEEKVNLPSTLSISLASDTGSSATDNITSNTLIEGVVANPDGPSAGLAVEIDLDEDGSGDAIVFTDQSGQYHFQADSLPFDDVLVTARVVEWDEEAGEYVIGDPAGFVVTRQVPGSDPAHVSQFSTLQTAVTGTVTDPTLVGRIINDGPLANVVIEFDTIDNATQTPDQRTVTDTTGRFQFTPSSLTYDDHVILARAREFDAATGQMQTSAWVSLGFEYLQTTNTAGVVSSLTLVEDTATAGDARTSNPGVTGVVQNSEGLVGLTVEIDHNQDNIPDGFATTDSSGHFTYTPSALAYAAYVFRARVKEYDEVGAPIVGGWTSRPFTYDADPSTAARIATLSLTSDTGNSSTDGATANAAVSGTVTGVSGAVTIYFDHQGDGLSDASVTTDAAGNFSYTPVGLEQGFVVLRASLEAGTTAFAAASSRTLRFVFSSDPDGTEAQALLSSYSTYASSRQQAHTDYQNALAAAAQAYSSSQHTAGSSYEGTVATANQAREAARLQAQATYNLAVSTADSAYAAALANANGQFVTDLAAYNGDTTTFALNEFAWPGQPIGYTFEIASDSSQRTAPVRPVFYGTPYDWANDPTYQAALAEADRVYQAARQEAEQEFAAAKVLIDLVYAGSLAAAHGQYMLDVVAAEAAYQLALHAGTNPVDITQANKDYSDGTAALARAEARELGRLATGARLPQTRAITARYDKKREDLRYALENKQHDHHEWNRNRIANADQAKALALSAAARKRDDAIAAAGRKRTEDLADAAYTRDHDIEHARIAAQVAKSDARVAPITAWDAALNTPWTQYYKELVLQHVDFVSAVAAAQLTRYDTDIDAQRVEIQAVAAKKETLAKGTAGLREAHANADAISNRTLAIADNATIKVQRKDDNAAWHTYIFATIDLDLVHIQQVDPINLEYTNSRNDIEAEPGNPEHGPPYLPYVYTVNWERVETLYQMLVGANGFYRKQLDWSQRMDIADRSYVTALNNVWHVYQAGIYDHRLARRRSGADHQKTFDQGVADNAYTFAVGFADKYKAYLRGAADDTKSKEQTQNAAAKAFVDARSQASHALIEAAANSTSDFHVALELAHNTLVGLWDASLATAWSGLQKDIADAALVHTTANAAAVHTKVSGVAGKQLTWELGDSAADKSLADDGAAADHAESQSLADAIATYAAGTAAARRVHAYAVATANHSHERHIAQKDADYYTGVSLREREYQDAVAALQLDPTTGGQNYNGIDYDMWKYVGWNFKPWAGVSQPTPVEEIHPEIPTGYRGGPFAPFRWNQKDLDYYLEAAAIDFQHVSDRYDETGYETERLALLETYRTQLQVEDETYQLAKAAAERAKVIGGNGATGDVQAHYAWVMGVGDEDVALAQAVQAASDILADALKTATAGLSTDEANAANQFAHDLNTASKDYGDTTANCDNAYDKGVVVVENDLRSALVTADDTQAESIVVARGEYETLLYTQHKIRIQAATLPVNPGILSELHALHLAAATADVAWSQSQVNAALSQQQAQTAAHQIELFGGINAQGEQVPGELASNQSHVFGVADAKLNHAQTSNTLQKTLEDSNGNASKDAFIAVRTAEAADAARRVKAEEKYDLARQIAKRAHHQKVEDALVTWATTVEAAKYNYWDDYHSVRFYAPGAEGYEDAVEHNLNNAVIRDAAIAAAETPYDDALQQARIDHATDIGNAQSVWAQEQAQSGEAREQDNKTALTAEQSASNAADSAYLSGAAGTSLTKATVSGLAEKAFQDNAAKRNELMASIDGQIDVTYSASTSANASSRAEDLVELNADFVIAQAAIAAQRAQSAYNAALLASPQPSNLSYLHFLSAQATAFHDWLAGLKDEYLAYQVAIRAAGNAQGMTQQQAQATATAARAGHVTAYTLSESSREYNHLLAETTRDGQHAQAVAGHTHGHASTSESARGDLHVGYAAMDTDQLIGRTTAERNYQLMLAALDEGEYASAADVHAYRLARAQALYDWTIAYSNEDAIWTTDVSEAIKDLDVSFANATFTYKSGKALGLKTKIEQEAQDKHSKAVAYAQAQNAYDSALTAAFNNLRTAQYEAQGDWLEAAYSQQATVLAALHTDMNLPWSAAVAGLADAKAQWWSSDGSAQWTDLANALNASDSAHTTDANTAALTLANAIANAQYDYVVNAAHDTYDKIVAELSGDKTYAISIAGADKVYQIDTLHARNFMRNQAAALALEHADEIDNQFDPSILPEYASLEEFNSVLSVAALDHWTISEAAAQAVLVLSDAEAFAAFTASSNEHLQEREYATLLATRDYNLAIGQAALTHNMATANAVATYKADSAASYATAIHTYALANSSPWTDRADAIAEADRIHESALADALRDFQEAMATDEQTLSALLTNAVYSHDVARFNATLAKWAADRDSLADHNTAYANALSTWAQSADALVPDFDPQTGTASSGLKNVGGPMQDQPRAPSTRGEPVLARESPAGGNGLPWYIIDDYAYAPGSGAWNAGGGNYSLHDVIKAYRIGYGDNDPWLKAYILNGHHIGLDDVFGNWNYDDWFYTEDKQYVIWVEEDMGSPFEAAAMLRKALERVFGRSSGVEMKADALQYLVEEYTLDSTTLRQILGVSGVGALTLAEIEMFQMILLQKWALEHASEQTGYVADGVVITASIANEGADLALNIDTLTDPESSRGEWWMAAVGLLPLVPGTLLRKAGDTVFEFTRLKQLGEHVAGKADAIWKWKAATVEKLWSNGVKWDVIEAYAREGVSGKEIGDYIDTLGGARPTEQQLWDHLRELKMGKNPPKRAEPILATVVPPPKTASSTNSNLVTIGAGGSSAGDSVGPPRTVAPRGPDGTTPPKGGSDYGIQQPSDKSLPPAQDPARPRKPTDGAVPTASPEELTKDVLKDFHKNIKKNPDSPVLKPGWKYRIDDQVFSTDHLGRLKETKFTLDSQSLEKGGRSHYQTEIGELGEIDDIGFHLRGDQFNGSSMYPNIVPFDKEINKYAKGAYGKLEQLWKTAITKHKKVVEVHVTVIYHTGYGMSNLRPKGLEVTTIIDGKFITVSIDDAHKILDQADLVALQKLIGE